MLRDRARIEDNAVEILAKEVRQFTRPLKTVEDLDPLMEPPNIINGAPASVPV